ncbi:SIR2 family protein [Cupriavidus basilensis]
MSETVFGSRLQLAQMWAEAYHFPMAAHERDEAAAGGAVPGQVSQQGVFPRRLFFKFAYQHLSQQYRDILPPALSALRNEDIIAQLGEVVCTVGRAQRRQDPANPYRAMARLKLPVYLTTDPSDLLADALREGGADPGIRLCRWNRQAEACDDLLSEGRKRANPTAQAPMVLKLFGDLREPGSLVLTEDQYFDYPHQRVDEPQRHPAGRAGAAQRQRAAVRRLRRAVVGIPHPVPQHPQPGGRGPAPGIPAPFRAARSQQHRRPGERAPLPGALLPGQGPAQAVLGRRRHVHRRTAAAPGGVRWRPIPNLRTRHAALTARTSALCRWARRTPSSAAMPRSRNCATA